MKYGDICLLENVRFNEGEEQNDLNFAKVLADSFNVYINDAFSASHRQHASIVGITNYLPSLAGNTLVKEFKNLVGTTRKYAIPLLEYLDKLEITYRDNNERKLNK